MSRSSRSGISSFASVFLGSLLLTILVYGLRGVGILTFIPGGIILALIGLSIVTGLIYGIQKTKRF